MPFVTISEDAAARSERDAERDQRRAKRKRWRYQYSAAPEHRIGSYNAEEAVAALMGITFTRDPDGFGKPDVANWSVRYGSRRGYGLVIDDRDKHYPYVLVTPGYAALEYEVVGWLRRAEAVELKERGIGRALPGERNAWLIPAQYLHEWGVK